MDWPCYKKQIFLSQETAWVKGGQVGTTDVTFSLYDQTSWGPHVLPCQYGIVWALASSRPRGTFIAGLLV